MSGHPVNERPASERVAAAITGFCGSMAFVWVHVVLFAFWMVLGQAEGFDRLPFGLLTMTVSLEAIFLATFVMIGQNLQAKFQEEKADLDYEHNLESLKILRELHKLRDDLNG